MRKTYCCPIVFIALIVSACATAPTESTPTPAVTAASTTESPAEAVDPGESALLMGLIQTGDCEELAHRLDQGGKLPAMDAFGYTPLGMASAQIAPACIQTLLDHGANVNEPMSGGWTPIILVAMGGAPVPVMELLTSHGADLNARNRWGCTALYYASGFGSQRAVDFLLTHGAAYPGTGGDCLTPMKIAQLRGYPAVIEQLQPLEAAQAPVPAETPQP